MGCDQNERSSDETGSVPAVTPRRTPSRSWQMNSDLASPALRATTRGAGNWLRKFASGKCFQRNSSLTLLP